MVKFFYLKKVVGGLMEELYYKGFARVYKCGHCNGDMIYSGITLANKHEHRCQGCHSLDYFNHCYPMIHYDLYPRLSRGGELDG